MRNKPDQHRHLNTHSNNSTHSRSNSHSPSVDSNNNNNPSSGSHGSSNKCRSLVCDSSGIIIAEMVYRCMICYYVTDSITEAKDHYTMVHMQEEEEEEDESDHRLDSKNSSIVSHHHKSAAAAAAEAMMRFASGSLNRNLPSNGIPSNPLLPDISLFEDHSPLKFGNTSHHLNNTLRQLTQQSNLLKRNGEFFFTALECDSFFFERISWHFSGIDCIFWFVQLPMVVSLLLCRLWQAKPNWPMDPLAIVLRIPNPVTLIVQFVESPDSTLVSKDDMDSLPASLVIGTSEHSSWNPRSMHVPTLANALSTSGLDVEHVGSKDASQSSLSTLGDNRYFKLTFQSRNCQVVLLHQRFQELLEVPLLPLWLECWVRFNRGCLSKMMTEKRRTSMTIGKTLALLLDQVKSVWMTMELKMKWKMSRLWMMMSKRTQLQDSKARCWSRKSHWLRTTTMTGTLTLRSQTWVTTTIIRVRSAVSTLL